MWTLLPIPTILGMQLKTNGSDFYPVTCHTFANESLIQILDSDGNQVSLVEIKFKIEDLGMHLKFCH